MRDAGPLIVTGFHRSGTSAAARLLHLSGADLGEELIGARASNPHGHYEDAAVVALHDRLLADAGSSWRRDRALPVSPGAAGMEAMAARARPGVWGFKDPRACFFLQAWSDAHPAMRVIGVVRHPAAAVPSLLRRELRLAGTVGGDHRAFAEDPDLAVRMWIAHNRLLADRAAAHPDATLLVSYTRLRSGAPLIDEVERRWGLGLTPIHTHAAVAPGFPAAAPGTVRSAEAMQLWHDLSARESAEWEEASARV